jgi:hypothetical protein
VLTRKLAARNPKVLVLALTLLDGCVKNSGALRVMT